MTENWNPIIRHLVATLPSDIDARRNLLCAALDVVPKSHPGSVQIRLLVHSLDAHLLNQREFNFPQERARKP